MTEQARPRVWLPLAAYAAVAVLTTWPLVMVPSTRLGAPIGAGDPYLNLWILGWGMQTVLRDPAALLDGRVFDANIFHPAADTLAYSDHLLLQSTLLAPLYALTGDVALCYNVLLLVSLVASALAMHVCARALLGSEGGAYLAGLAWGFGSYRFAHLLHLQLQSLYWLPLAWLCLHRVVAARRWRDGVVLGVVTGLQAVSSVYYAVIGGVGLVVAAVALLLSAVRRGRSRVLGRLALAAVVAGAVALPVGLVYWRVQQEQGFGRSVFEASQGAARLDSYLRVPVGNVLYGWTSLLREAPGARVEPRQVGPERELFPGVVLVVLAVAGAWLGGRGDARPLVMALLAAGAVGLVLSLGPDGLRGLYAWLHRSVFGFQAIRAPARFSVLVQFALALLAALGWRELFGRRHGAGTRLPGAVAVVVCAVAAAEWMHVPTALAAAPPRTTPVGQWLAQAPGQGAVVVLPMGLDTESTPAMVQSLEHRRPLLNGYSGQRPEFYPAVVDAVRGFPDDGAMVVLHDRGVQYVVAPSLVELPPDSPLVLRVSFPGAVIYELVWTPEAEARLAARVEVAPPPPGPVPFAVGERVEYGVRWEGGVNLEAGRITLEVAGPPYRFTATARTAPWVSRFFEADDQFTTVTDEALAVQTHDREQHEGARHVTRSYVYDEANRVVRMGPSLEQARAPGATTLPLDRGARDAIAALQYVRTLAYSAGQRYLLPINEGGRNLRLDVQVVGVETVLVQGLPVRAWRLDPALRERVERRRPPTARVWVSDDARRVPVRIDVDAPFGRVSLELRAYQAGQ